MKVEIAEQGANKVRLDVEATADEFEEALARGLPPFLAAMGLHVSPEDDYEQAVRKLAGDDGDEALNGMKLDCAVGYLTPRAVESAGLVPACNPGIFGSERRPDGSVVFGLEVYPKPEVRLSDYGPVTVRAKHPVVTEEEIDRRIDAMAARGAVTQPDIVTGKPKKVPAIIDDRWVRKNVEGCNSVADLRAHLRAAGEKYKADAFAQQVQEQALDDLAQRIVDPVPEETVEAVADSMMGELANQIAQQGLTLQEFVVQRKVTLDQMRDDARARARSMLVQGAVLDEVFRHEGLALQDGDIDAALAAIAPGVESKARESLERNGFMFTVEETARRMRAMSAIMEHVDVQYLD